jgi:hypothetical protein
MPPRLRLLLSTLSVTLFILAAVPLYRGLAGRNDIWWTPATMLVPLVESADRVQIYAHGQPLAALLQAGQVQIAEGARTSVLTPNDIGVRFNNWDRVRAERLPVLLVSAAACGVTALLFLLVLTGRLAYRGEKGAVAA